MACTYRAQPKNPVDYFARWLLNQSQVAKNQLLEEERANKKLEIEEKYEDLTKAKAKVEAEKQAVKTAEETKIADFRAKVAKSKDLEYELPNLVEHLKEQSGATACYIGKVVVPKKPIKDDDDDKAHINPDAVP